MKRLLTRLLPAALTLCCAATAAPAQEGEQEPQQEIVVIAPTVRRGPPARERTIRRYLAATRVVEKEQSMIEVVVAAMKRQSPQIPDKTWDEVKAEFKKAFNPEEIISIYVKIYARRFTEREMRQLAAFFESPVGRRLVAETDGINMDAFAEGVSRGLSIVDRIRELLKSRGFNVPVT